MSRPKTATIMVKSLDGGWETIGVDRAAGIWHEGLEQQWDSWGPSGAQFTLRRDSQLPWPDISAYADVRIEVGGVQNWSGRVKGTPSRDGADRAMSVQCEGWQAHLDDDCVVPFYVHTRVNEWKDVRSDLTSDLTTFVAAPKVEVGSGGAVLAFPANVVTVNGKCAGIYLDAGPGGLISHTVVDYVTQTTRGNMGFGIYVSNTGPGTGGTLIASRTFGTSAPFTDGNPHVGSRYVTIVLSSAAGGDFTDPTDIHVAIKAIRCFADTSYQSSGLSTLKASAVLRDALTRGTLLLNPDWSLIQDTAFNIPDLADTAGDRTPREIAEGVNGYHNWCQKIDEQARPVFRPLAATSDLEVGSWAAVEGTDASQNSGENIYNRAIVRAQSPTGAPLRFERFSTGVLEKSAPQLDNPGAEVDTATWTYTGNPGGTLTRDTGTTHAGAGSFRITSAGAGAKAVATVAAGTFRRGRVYVLELYLRNDASGNFSGTFPFTDDSGMQFRFGTTTDDGKTNVSSFTAGAWVRVLVVWSPRTTVNSGVRFEWRQGAAGTGSLRLDSFTVYRSVATVADRRSFLRAKRLGVSAPLGTDGAAGNQIADAYLSTHRLAQFAGEYEITGPVRHRLTGEKVPPEQLGMRTTDLLMFADRIDPDDGSVGREGRLVGVTYRLDKDQARVAIDNTSTNFDAVIARLAALSGGSR